MLKIILVLPLAMLSACATLIDGTSQTVTVSTTPTGASCMLDRAGARVGAISATPGSVRLDKSKNDLSVTCSKDGFQTATVAQSSNFNGVTFGNILLGGVVGIVVDAASGANFNYPADIRLDLAASFMPSSSPLVSQAPSSMPETAIRLTPVASQSDFQPALIQPISVNSVNGVGRSGRLMR